MNEELQEVVRLLCSSMKLERDKSVVELERTLPGLSFSERLQLQKHLMKLLSDSENPWETKHGSLLGAKSLIPYLNAEDDVDCNFIFTIKKISQKLLTDIEVRVRLAAGEVLGLLCKKMGTEVYEESRDIVLKLIQSNLERNLLDDDSSRLERLETGKLVEKLVGGPNCEKKGADVAKIFQNTAGWKNLETSLKALQCMVDGCGLNFQPFIDEELLSLIFKTLIHSNQFVRETGFYVCSSLVSCGNTDSDLDVAESITAVNPVFVFGQELCQYLAKGLADDWSQVRLAASVAARSFLISLQNDGLRQVFYPQLLPRMCLNRYYAADGVRIYSQETWRQVIGSAGNEMVEQHIESVVEYYKEASLSDNHAAREAACACIAELASKISNESVRPFVSILLNALLDCFQDNYWAVRDAACLACGNFVLCFPNECSFAMSSLYPLFYRNLSDPIPSVRQGAASALANVVRAYKKNSLNHVMDFIRQSLESVKKQESRNDNRYLEISTRSIRHNLFYRGHESDARLSCVQLGDELLMANMKGNKGTNQKESQLWEAADGYEALFIVCVYLIGELSHLKDAQDEVLSVVPLLREAGRYRHYSNHVVFLETVCKQIPILARNLGKKNFKSIVEEFFDIIFYSMECENALTSSAANQCLSYIATFLGPNILRGKINNFNPNYVKYLDTAVNLSSF